MSTNVWGHAQLGAAKPAYTSSFARFVVMVQKELLELLRSYKLLWVPLVFILLGIMQPVSTYFMPVILEKAGSLPEGTVIEIPTPLGSEVLAQTLQQFGTIGVLVLVLVCMGTVSGERSSGTASLILVKPVSVLSFIGSKWTAMLLLTWGALIVGYFAAWYYTGLLFEEVSFAKMVGSLLIFGLWLSFLVTITILFSALLRSPAAAAFSALGGAVGLTLLAGLFPKQLGWSPGTLSGFASASVTTGIANTSRFGLVIALTIIGIAAAIALSAWVLRRSSAVE
ncbi:ABC transporter permease [Paenibacillus sp. PL91]|uniref:ABC transporter permease n=1 Tax=Paenibacillus sp. PL91 TaxID=2729538 RepID=UPI00145F093C|nr:ABC transporter permease subunit [Paenibacillus sp. PL91]MBC9203537.1 ABC transporter permease subunit [Paenibacillus sp. PL91]